MGREFHTLEDFRTELNTAIDMAIENRVIDGAKKAIQESEDRNVYSYEPKFWWAKSTRRMDAGGIQDKKNMSASSDLGSIYEKKVEITVEAPWQWADPVANFNESYSRIKKLPNRPNPTGDLVDTIEKKGMYGAPPRPFMKDAEETYGSGEFENDLKQGLFELGFDD